MKSMIKYIIVLVILLIILGLSKINEDTILTVYKNITYKEANYVITNSNEYTRNYDFDYVQRTTSLVAKEKQDILNIYFSELNVGNTEFEFMCDDNYKNCLNDVESLASDNTSLNYLNNFIHPFNAFKNIKTTHNELGIVSVTITRAYTDEEINKINEKIDSIYPTLTQGYNKQDQNSIINTIRTIHDYIINTTKYDSNRADNGIIEYSSEKAIGPLFEGYALCGGYTDLMQLFLERMEIESIQITANNHIWNAVNISNKWYNLDLTWDDPVVSTGQQTLLEDYFLIDTNRMKQLDTTKHSFNESIYKELI